MVRVLVFLSSQVTKMDRFPVILSSQVTKMDRVAGVRALDVIFARHLPEGAGREAGEGGKPPPCNGSNTPTQESTDLF